MLIGPGDAQVGSRAMASVLLLYDHLLRGGGISNDETVYVEPEAFDAFDFLDVEVAAEHGSEIDQQLLREGAVVHLLCDLNDMISEFDGNFLAQPLVCRILEAHAEGRVRAVPEFDEVVNLLSAGEANVDHSRYRQLLAQVFHRDVAGRIRDLLPAGGFTSA